MTAKKPLKYRTLRRILSSFGVVEIKRRGKGSHGIVEGRRVNYPTNAAARGDEKPIAVIEAIRRAFHLGDTRWRTTRDIMVSEAGQRKPALPSSTLDPLMVEGPKRSPSAYFGIVGLPALHRKERLRTESAHEWLHD